MNGGGAERQLVYLATELTRRRWDVHVALLKEGPNYEKLAASGCTIHKIGSRGNHDITIIGRLFNLIRSVRPGLVQTWINQMDVFGGIASRLASVPFILSERSSSPNYPQGFKNALRVAVGRRADAIVCNSAGGKHYWEMKIGDSVRKHIIGNGLPINDIAETEGDAPGFPTPPGSEILLFAGRFSPEKNIPNLVRAFRSVASQRNVILVLCGEGALRSEVEALVDKEGLIGRVMIAGYVENLWQIMKSAGLFIAVSTHEGLPNAVLEAMACRCPLLVSDIPAHRRLLDGEKAFFVNPNDVSAIAEGISACLERRDEAKERAEKAGKAALAFSVQAIVDQYETVYNGILSGRELRGHFSCAVS